MLDANLYEEELHPTPLMATWREFKQRHVAVFGLVILTLFIIVAIAGPLLSPYAPTTQHTNTLLIPPAWDDNGSILHVLGTDALGRDMLTRLFYGTQVTLFSSIVTVFIALGLGVAMGVVAGMSKGLRSSLINHVLDILMLTPTLLIAIIIVAILGTGLTNAMLANIALVKPVPNIATIIIAINNVGVSIKISKTWLIKLDRSPFDIPATTPIATPKPRAINTVTILEKSVTWVP